MTLKKKGGKVGTNMVRDKARGGNWFLFLPVGQCGAGTHPLRPK